MPGKIGNNDEWNCAKDNADSVKNVNDGENNRMCHGPVSF